MRSREGREVTDVQSDPVGTAPVSDAALAPGLVIDGRYVLERRLGAGAFGEVWRAADARLAARAVAVKVLHPEMAGDADAAARFDAEATALALLRHPNVVGVLDRGAWAGRKYLVMEYVEGASLARWLADHRARRAWPELAAVRALFDQVCAGVAAAHRVRAPGPIVHRDLKPANVVLAAGGDGALAAKVVDFGVAHLGGARTRTGLQPGTLDYMAPEQALGRRDALGPATDVFALGVLFAELATLDPRVDADQPWWGAALDRPGPAGAVLAGRRVDVPPAVWEVVARALDRDPRRRPPDAAALGAAVAAAWGTPPSRRGRPRAWPLVAAAALVGAAGGGVLGVASWRAEPSPRAPVVRAPVVRAPVVRAPAAPRPVPAVAVRAPPDIVQLAAGSGFTCALARDGTARCWGFNRSGRLGDGSQAWPPSPVTVVGLAGATRLALAAWTACALVRDGAARCWGSNDEGTIGDGTTEDRVLPTPVAELRGAVQLVARGHEVCAVLGDGTVRCWGDASDGVFGAAAARLCEGSRTPCAPTPVAVPGVAGVARLAMGGSHVCALLRGGAVRCWGGHYGAAGATAAGGLAGIVDLALGGAGDCALLRDGTVHCWRSAFGQPSAPRRVQGVEGAVQLAAGPGAACVVVRDGAARCWGRNGAGQLGDGTRTDRAAAAAVAGLAGAVEVAVGGEHACARSRDGAVWCWGRNDSRELGDGTTEDRLTPVRVRW